MGQKENISRSEFNEKVSQTVKHFLDGDVDQARIKYTQSIEKHSSTQWPTFNEIYENLKKNVENYFKKRYTVLG
jgi:hypothetical protein